MKIKLDKSSHYKACPSTLIVLFCFFLVQRSFITYVFIQAHVSTLSNTLMDTSGATQGCPRILQHVDWRNHRLLPEPQPPLPPIYSFELLFVFQFNVY